MKEHYLTPELHIVLFAPVEPLASQILEIGQDESVYFGSITEFNSAGNGASRNDGDVFLPF